MLAAAGELTWSLAVAVYVAALPLVAGIYQFILADLHGLRRRPRPDNARLPPRVAVVVPAWNEADVLGRTIDRLMAMEYPADRLRVYVVDDASTDGTPDVVLAASERYAGRVVHLRREKGGEGKAHTINHGLRQIRAEGWYEAILVIDADVIFTATALARMTAHFAEPAVGAVTAYIKEGSRPSNYLNRFIAFEYITAQAGARRAQNMLGAQACLAGGAQLITRDTLEAIGGEIDTTTLAEDTVTTFLIQLAGRRVVFEPAAIVWAEEPRELSGLWKQRVRWARGNVQITRRFKGVWLRRWRSGSLGGLSFALIWFTVTLMPVFMTVAASALIALFLIDPDFSSRVFRSVWAINLVTYAFITVSSFALDPATARQSWREGLAFPGAVSLAIMLYAVWPALFTGTGRDLLAHAGVHASAAAGTALVLFSYAWLAASMLAAWLVTLVEARRRLTWLTGPLLYLVGYGPLLCAITSAAYLKELRHADMTWEKTIKTGAVGDFG